MGAAHLWDQPGLQGKQQLLEDPPEGSEASQENTRELPPAVTPLRSLPRLPRDRGAVKRALSAG